MKKGMILCVQGQLPEGVAPDDLLKGGHVAFDVDKVAVVSSLDGEGDIHWAWWRMISKGFTSIQCRMAGYEKGQLALKGGSVPIWSIG